MIPSPPTPRFSDVPLDHAHPNNFDFFRYLLAVLVMLSHAFPLLSGENTHEPFIVLSRGQSSGGGVAVDLFFIMSGFLVTHSWMHSKNPVAYLAKRVRRIYPGYVVVVAISLMLVWVFNPIGRAFLQEQYLLSDFWLGLTAFMLPLIPSVFPGNPFPQYLNGSLWTIPYEFGCYLVLALLGVVGVIRQRHLLLGIFICTWALYSLGLSNAEVQAGLATYQLQHWVRMLSCFLAGSVFYRYRDRIPYSPRWMVLAGTLMLTLFFSGYGFVALLPILGAYVVLYLAFERRLLCTAFGQRGDHSYGIYLYAFPVQQLLIFGLHGWLTSWTLFALAWGVTAVCAWMSWVFVERPFLRRG